MSLGETGFVQNKNSALRREMRESREEEEEEEEEL
jgi:hypothetical protein